MDYRTGFRDGYMAARQELENSIPYPGPASPPTGEVEALAPIKQGRKKTSAYTRRYKAAFKRIAPSYKLKSGKWKKNGFQRTVKLAHKEAKR